MKKIPGHAQRVFEGERFCVWQWDQELFDGTHKIFESVTRDDVSTVIAVTKEKKLLFLEEQQSGKDITYTFPSGTLEEGDTPLLCAQRELQEETGYTSDSFEHWFTKGASNSVLYDYHFFIAKDAYKISEQNLDPGEKIISNEYTFEEILECIETVNFKNFILYPIFLKAKYHEPYRQELKRMFGIEN